eukprot:scaffold2.g7491.t1
MEGLLEAVQTRLPAEPAERLRLAAAVAAAGVLAYLLIALFSSMSRWVAVALRSTHIPSAPGGSLLLGHVLQLFPSGDNCAWERMLDWVRDQPGMVKFRILHRTGLVVNDAHALKRVFQTRQRMYDKDLDFSYGPFLPILGTGLVTANGAAWQKQRLLMAPALRIDMLDAIIPIAKRAVDRLCKRLEFYRGTGEPVDMQHEFHLLTLQIIGEAILSLDPQECDRVFPHLYIPVMEESNARVLSPWRKLYPTTAWTYNKKVRALNSYLLDIIRTRHALHVAGGPPKNGDILDRVIANILVRFAGARACGPRGRVRWGGAWEQGERWGAATETQLCYEIKTFLLAGHETSAAMLCWALYELSLAPERLAKLRAEAAPVFGDKARPGRGGGRARGGARGGARPAAPLSAGRAGGAAPTPPHSLARSPARGPCYVRAQEAEPTRQQVDDMVYTLSALKESLRKYSVVPVVTRNLTADDELCGMLVPKGTWIICHIEGVHQQYKAPQEWRPERFMPGGEYDSFDEDIRPYMFLPFIQGPRNCLGQYFSLLESRVILGVLSQRFTFTPVDPASQGRTHPHVVPIGPVNGMRIQPQTTKQRARQKLRLFLVAAAALISALVSWALVSGAAVAPAPASAAVCAGYCLTCYIERTHVQQTGDQAAAAATRRVLLARWPPRATSALLQRHRWQGGSSSSAWVAEAPALPPEVANASWGEQWYLHLRELSAVQRADFPLPAAAARPTRARIPAPASLLQRAGPGRALRADSAQVQQHKAEGQQEQQAAQQAAQQAPQQAGQQVGQQTQQAPQAAQKVGQQEQQQAQQEPQQAGQQQAQRQEVVWRADKLVDPAANPSAGAALAERQRVQQLEQKVAQLAALLRGKAREKEEKGRQQGEGRGQAWGRERGKAKARENESAEKQPDQGQPQPEQQQPQPEAPDPEAPPTDPRASYPNCTRCTACTHELEPLSTERSLLGVRYELKGLGASRAWIFRASSEYGEGGEAAAKVWCIPINKEGQPSPGCELASPVHPCQQNLSLLPLPLTVLGAGSMDKYVSKLQALDKLIDDCDVRPLFSRVWVEHVRGLLPRFGYVVDSDGMFMDIAPGVPVHHQTFMTPRDRMREIWALWQTVNSTHAAVFDLLTAQCDRHAENVFVDGSGRLTLIGARGGAPCRPPLPASGRRCRAPLPFTCHNDQMLGESWRTCGFDSIFLPLTQKHAINVHGYQSCPNPPPTPTPQPTSPRQFWIIRSRYPNARPKGYPNPQLFFDYRCHAPGGRVGTRGYPPGLLRCLRKLDGMSVDEVVQRYGFHERQAAILRGRARDMLREGFEWTLERGRPRNPPPIAYDWQPPCCNMTYVGHWTGVKDDWRCVDRWEPLIGEKGLRQPWLPPPADKAEALWQAAALLRSKAAAAGGAARGLSPAPRPPHSPVHRAGRTLPPRTVCLLETLPAVNSLTAPQLHTHRGRQAGGAPPASAPPPLLLHPECLDQEGLEAGLRAAAAHLRAIRGAPPPAALLTAFLERAADLVDARRARVAPRPLARAHPGAGARPAFPAVDGGDPEAPLLVLEILSWLPAPPAAAAAAALARVYNRAAAQLAEAADAAACVAAAAAADAAGAAPAVAPRAPALLSPEQIVRFYEAQARTRLAVAGVKSRGLGTQLRAHLRQCRLSGGQALRLLCAWAALGSPAQPGGTASRRFRPTPHDFADLRACLRPGCMAGEQLEAAVAAAAAFPWPTWHSLPLLCNLAAETVRRTAQPGGQLSAAQGRRILALAVHVAASMRPQLARQLQAFIAERQAEHAATAPAPAPAPVPTPTPALASSPAPAHAATAPQPATWAYWLALCAAAWAAQSTSLATSALPPHATALLGVAAIGAAAGASSAPQSWRRRRAGAAGAT